MPPLRVLVVDDQPAFTDALAALLATEPSVHVVGVAFDAASAVAAARRLRPDVVTVDLEMGGADGAAVVAAIHAADPRAAITVVSGVVNPHRAIAAIWSGARAWVSKDDCAATLFDVVRRAAVGESCFPPALLGQVLQMLVADGAAHRPRPGRLASLTSREYDVLLCLVEGLDRKATADRLRLSVNTVRTHVQSIFAKLHAHNTLEAVAVALDEGVRAPHAEEVPASAGAS